MARQTVGIRLPKGLVDIIQGRMEAEKITNSADYYRRLIEAGLETEKMREELRLLSGKIQILTGEIARVKRLSFRSVYSVSYLFNHIVSNDQKLYAQFLDYLAGKEQEIAKIEKTRGAGKR